MLGYTLAVSRRRSFEVPGLQHDNPIPMGSVIGPFLMTSGIFGSRNAENTARHREPMPAHVR